MNKSFRPKLNPSTVSFSITKSNLIKWLLVSKITKQIYNYIFQETKNNILQKLKPRNKTLIMNKKIIFLFWDVYAYKQNAKKIPSEALFLDCEAAPASRWWSGCFPISTDKSLPLIVALEVDKDDLSSCLSKASLIRFRSTEPANSDLEPPTRSLSISLYSSSPTMVFFAVFWLSPTHGTIND